MKVRPNKYFLIIFITSLCYTAVSAQEGGFLYDLDERDQPEMTPSPGSEKVYRIKNGESAPHTENEGTEKKEAAPAKKITPQVTSETNKDKERQPESKPVIDTTNKEEDPDSVLSFNFLHYIIQRFKFSDVIDQ